MAPAPPTWAVMWQNWHGNLGTALFPKPMLMIKSAWWRHLCLPPQWRWCHRHPLLKCWATTLPMCVHVHGQQSLYGQFLAISSRVILAVDDHPWCECCVLSTFRALGCSSWAFLRTQWKRGWHWGGWTPPQERGKDYGCRPYSVRTTSYWSQHFGWFCKGKGITRALHFFPGTIFCSNHLLHRKSKQSWQWSVNVTSHAHSLTETPVHVPHHCRRGRNWLLIKVLFLGWFGCHSITIMGGNLPFTSSVLLAVTACVHQCSLPSSLLPLSPPSIHVTWRTVFQSGWSSTTAVWRSLWSATVGASMWMQTRTPSLCLSALRACWWTPCPSCHHPPSTSTPAENMMLTHAHVKHQPTHQYSDFTIGMNKISLPPAEKTLLGKNSMWSKTAHDLKQHVIQNSMWFCLQKSGYQHTQS